MHQREDETARMREELTNLRQVLDAINSEFAVDLEAKTALLKKENTQLMLQRDEARTALEEANSKLSKVSTDSDKSLFLEQQLHVKDQEIEKLRAESTFDSCHAMQH
jgi:predicted RNase H-like nuclease (RuvC/YqgF family)